LSSRIPISGIGIVAPGAIGVEAFRALLQSGRSAVLPVDRFDTQGMAAKNAGLVRDFSPKEFIAPMKMRRMNMLSRLALSAAKLALRDAGVDALDPATGVALGTAFGPVQTSVDYMQEYVEKGAALAPPQLFAESVANAPGSHIAIELGLRGFNVTITQRESSALAAAMYGSSQIMKGMAPAALIGGVEEVNEMIFSVLDRVGALRPAEGGPGIEIGEGSAVLIAGAANPAKVYGYFSGFGIARDTTASVSDWGSDSRAVVAAMAAAIDDAGIRREDVDAVYASANGNARGDRLEDEALRVFFGNSMPLVVKAKSYFGEYAAGGALQLAAGILAVADNRLRHVLVNSLSAGGGIVCAVISREAG
jgi:3-oxoacyl-[acyl-carrier-protein] synthase II